jgi:formylglycine-generating enzyme required for sulfatase activity
VEHELGGLPDAKTGNYQAGVRVFFLATFFFTALPALSADFRKDVQPVLERFCTACHGASKQAGGVRLDTAAGMLKVVVRGKPAESSLITSLELPSNQPSAMPPGGPQLSLTERAAIRDWIAAGVAWPAGVTLSSTAKPTVKVEDNTSLAVELRQRIITASPDMQPAEMKAYKTTIPGTDVSYEMTPIPGGEFEMGSPDSEPGHKADEGPVHRVRIEPFWMSVHEVTWDEYRLFMFAKQARETTGKDSLVDAVSRPTRPYVEMSFGMGINGYPAISMTQHAANKYAEWLSAKTGQFYRLPTEAEWEYACRAGTQTPYPFGSDPAQLGEYAWFSENSAGKYQKVATKKPNPWGLYDMLGNIMEWTLDQYLPNYTTVSSLTTEPWVKASKPYPHAVRGGSWKDEASALRCSARVGSDASWKMQDPQLPKSIWYHTDAQWLGFRLVRPLKTPSAEQMFQYWNSGVEKE